MISDCQFGSMERKHLRGSCSGEQPSDYFDTIFPAHEKKVEHAGTAPDSASAPELFQTHFHHFLCGAGHLVPAAPRIRRWTKRNSRRSPISASGECFCMAIPLAPSQVPQPSAADDHHRVRAGVAHDHPGGVFAVLQDVGDEGDGACRRGAAGTTHHGDGNSMAISKVLSAPIAEQRPDTVQVLSSFRQPKSRP